MLTPRQREVASLVARGMSRKEIASRVGISVETVKVHVRQAAAKLEGDARPRRKFALFFLQIGEDTDES